MRHWAVRSPSPKPQGRPNLQGPLQQAFGLASSRGTDSKENPSSSLQKKIQKPKHQKQRNSENPPWTPEVPLPGPPPSPPKKRKLSGLHLLRLPFRSVRDVPPNEAGQGRALGLLAWDGLSCGFGGLKGFVFIACRVQGIGMLRFRNVFRVLFHLEFRVYHSGLRV